MQTIAVFLMFCVLRCIRKVKQGEYSQLILKHNRANDCTVKNLGVVSGQNNYLGAWFGLGCVDRISGRRKEISPPAASPRQ
jgi:hypothetical protein